MVSHYTTLVASLELRIGPAREVALACEGSMCRPIAERKKKKTCIVSSGTLNSATIPIAPRLKVLLTSFATDCKAYCDTTDCGMSVMQGDGDKSVYAVSGLAWGAYTDAEMRKKR